MRPATCLLLMWLALPMPAMAQEAAPTAEPAARGHDTALPFAPGEVLTFTVRLGIFTVGESSMRVSAIEPTRGIATYPLEWRLEGGIPFYAVDTKMQSWMDIERLVSLRFIHDQHEGRYTRFRNFEFYPEQRMWRRIDNGEEGPLDSSSPLDDLSFIYFARTLDFEVGQEYRFDRYFKESGNPVTIKVLRRDQRSVPAGTFKTIVLQPIIRTTGLFGEGGKAELHLSDDPRRLLVYLKARMPGINFTMHLKRIGNDIPASDEVNTGVSNR